MDQSAHFAAIFWVTVVLGLAVGAVLLWIESRT